MTPEEFTDLCKRLEHFETPEWAARAILEKEILTRTVVDPCAGSGILSRLVQETHDLYALDIYDWGHPIDIVADYLSFTPSSFACEPGFTVFMNPPFSLAEQFVKKSFELGARKILCFQRFAWWESKGRKDFWREFPPARIYICGDRAACWRHDIPAEDRDSGTPTAHAWFVFEPAHPAGTIIGHIYK